MTYSSVLPGEIGEDVVDGGVERIDMNVDAQVQRGRKGEGCGLGAGVDLVLHGGERFARGGEPIVRDFVFDLHEQDAGVFRAADGAESREQIFFTVAELAVDHDDGFRAVIARVDRFGDQAKRAA